MDKQRCLRQQSLGCQLGKRAWSECSECYKDRQLAEEQSQFAFVTQLLSMLAMDSDNHFRI